MAKRRHRLTLDKFAERLCADGLGTNLGRVACKFVHSMLKGIHRTESINLTDVAKGLGEGISLHATQKRLSRNLGDLELNENLMDRLLRLGAAKVRPETRLIVHLYELNKKYARKMEYLSAPEPIPGTGYKVCEILASDPDSETYAPLLARVWSDRVPGFVSDGEEVKKAIHRVLAATGNRGLLYFDDTSLSGSLLQPLMEDPAFDFIALTPGMELEVLYRSKVCSLQALLEQVETRYGKTMFKLIPEGMLGVAKTDLDLFIHVGALGIKLPGSERSLSLIALGTKNAYLGDMVAPMLTSRTKLRSRKSLMGLVESFLSIQDILAVHRARRDSFNPANFRVLTYHRLQLLMTLLQSVLHYQARVVSKVPVSHPLFAERPHDGELERTYLLPGQNQRQAEMAHRG